MICNLGVVGSIPSIGSKVLKRILGEYQSGQMGQTVNLLVFTFGGSNPSSPTKARQNTDRAFTLKSGVFVQVERNENWFTLPRHSRKTRKIFKENFAEVAQSVEHQPSKLRVAGSNLVFRSNYASVAQG